MKLDSELAFYHSNIGGLEPESQSFEFDDNDLNENQNVKDHEKRVSIGLKTKRGDSDVLLSYDMEAEDGLTASKLDPHIGMIDLKNDNEVEVKDFIEPMSHSPFLDSPEDIELVKNSPIVPISDPPEEASSFKNPADIYTDKSVLECEPELVVCYKESSYNVVKDICVDEGIPTKDKILFEKNVNEEDDYKFLPSEDYRSEKSTKDNIGGTDVSFPVLVDSPATGESDEAFTNHHKSKDLMSSDREMVLSKENYAQFSSEPEMHSKHEESEDRAEEAVSTSLLTFAVDESNGDVAAGSDGSTPPENGSITSRFNPPALVAGAKEESHSKCDDTQNSSEPSDRKSDDQAMTSHFRHGSLGESSFSAVGQISNRISYSDPVHYSGSISLRSDSSTTSTRSFAFPVLQSEWNSSPVRMAKADRRHYRKHRGWRQGLLCCRF